MFCGAGESAIDIADIDAVGGVGDALTLAIVYVPFRIDDKTSAASPYRRTVARVSDKDATPVLLGKSVSVYMVHFFADEPSMTPANEGSFAVGV